MKILSFMLILAGMCRAEQCQVITRQDIQNYGIRRVADLLRLARGWHAITVDGFYWQTGLRDYCGSRNPSWVLMVDGQRIDMNFVGEKSLNVLPITIDAIDSVVVYSAPRLHQGEFTDVGLFHIYTGQPAFGKTICMRYADCNESGDPGPYQYTQLASENVDQMGPDYSTTASLSMAPFFIRAMISTLRHPCTDSAILRRHSDLTWNLLRTQVSTLSLQFMINALQGHHRIYAAQGASGMPLLIDELGAELFFFAPLGTEIPVTNRYRHLGLNGELPIFSQYKLNYQMIASASQTARPVGYTGADFAWNMRTLHAVVELGKGRSDWHAGAAMDRFHLKTHSSVKNPFISLNKIFADYQKYFGSNHYAQIGAMVILHQHRAAIKGYCLMDFYKNERNNFQLNVAFMQRFFAEDNGWWYWKQNGYAGAGLVSYSRDEAEKEVYEHIAGNMTWHMNVHGNLSMTMDFHFRTARDFKMDLYRYHIEPFYSSVSVFPVSYSGLSGRSLGGSILVVNQTNSALKQELFYEWNKTFDRSNTVYLPFPMHRCSYAIDFRPVRSFGLWAMLRWQSSYQWPEYAAIDRESQGMYSSWIHSSFLVDAAVQKWLWRERIRGHLMMRNLLDSREIYHPLGASFNMRLYFLLELFLDQRKQ